MARSRKSTAAGAENLIVLPPYDLRHMLLVGVIGAFLYYIIYVSFVWPKGSYFLGAYEGLAWLVVLLFPLILYKKGADLSKIKYSFGWSFFAVMSYLYVPLILLLRLHGLPRAVALLITPILVSSIIYSVNEAVARYRAVSKTHIKVPFTSRVKAALFRLDPLMLSFIIIGTVVLLVFLIVPLLIMLAYAFIPPIGGKFYSNFVRIFTARQYVKLFHFPSERPWTFLETKTGTILEITGVSYGILLNSLINSVIVTVFATILGVIVAYVLARYSFPGKQLIRVLAVIPLFVTPFVNSYAIKLLFGPSGPISWVTKHLFGFTVEIADLAGVTIAQIMAFYPIVYLNAYAGFMGVDPTLEEQAENLGARGFKLFRSVTLPLALPGIAAGSIIVFIFSLEDLGAPIVFKAKDLMSYQIYTGFTTESGIISPEIAALGFVMLGFALAGFLAIKNYVGMRTYAMTSRGGRWKPRERRLGPVGIAIVYLILLPLIIWTMMPQITVTLMALNIVPPTTFKFNFDHITFKYMIDLFRDPHLFIYVRNTLTYAFTAVIFALILAIILGYVVTRAKIRFITGALDALATIPLAIPGLVIALGYYYFFSTFFSGTPLDPTAGPTVFQAWIVLITAYTIRKLPFVVRSVFAGFQQVHETLEEAALNLGATRRKTVFGIVLPLILAYVVSGATVGFIYISTEVSTSITIGNFRVDQAPMTWYMMNVFIGGHPEGIQYVAAMGLLLILIQLIAIIIIIVGLKQSYAFIGA